MPFASRLRQEIGLDVQMVQKVHENAPGIDDDVGLLLMFAVSQPEVKSVLEIGSGTSTAILAKSCLVFGKQFVSFDEGELYRGITANTLAKLGIPCDLRLLPEDAAHGRASIEIDFIPDLLWLDGGGREAILRINPFRNTHLILVDDINFEGLRLGVDLVLLDWGRTNSHIYNPLKRIDRHVLINCISQEFDIRGWVASWGGN